MTLYLIIGVIYFVGFLAYVLMTPYHHARLLAHVNFGIQDYGYAATFGVVCLAVVVSVCFWPIEIAALLYRKYK